ncbi:hypothetical protein ABES58_13560 [Paenibacillus lautus]|uniref:hypothetical protein n=1 Tax=Paenibacillus TaxID=44249 RepID=UPI0030D96E6D
MEKKAKKILLQTFWSSSGWKNNPMPFAGEDFEYAKSMGLMFDPITIGHDELIQRLQSLHQSVTKEKVAAAFLHSLSTKQVHLRSALSSWALTSRLPLHTYEERCSAVPNYSSCGDCNHAGIQSDRDYVNTDLNVLNFERVKWGGIRLNQLLYCWLDLELLSHEETLTVGDEDIGILRGLIEAVEDCTEQESPRHLEKRWKDILPSSKHERDVLMEVWGYAGVLVPKDTPRTRPRRDDDFFSMSEWQGSDGYSREALQFYFGEYL